MSHYIQHNCPCSFCDKKLISLEVLLLLLFPFSQQPSCASLARTNRSLGARTLCPPERDRKKENSRNHPQQHSHAVLSTFSSHAWCRRPPCANDLCGAAAVGPSEKTEGKKKEKRKTALSAHSSIYLQRVSVFRLHLDLPHGFAQCVRHKNPPVSQPSFLFFYFFPP